MTQQKEELKQLETKMKKNTMGTGSGDEAEQIAAIRSKGDDKNAL